MGDHCTNNPPLGWSKHNDEIVKLGDTEVYISKPADTDVGTRLLVLLTNGVGIHSVNNQVQADHLQKPDILWLCQICDPAPNTVNVATTTEEEFSLLDQIKMRAVEGNALKAVKEQYGDKEYRTSHGIHVVGYCFGGKYALRLAATDEVSAVAVAHGTMISREDFVGVKNPVTFACVENDPLFPDEIREEGLKLLQERNIEHELKVYKGVPHGFAVYGSYPDHHIKLSQEKVFDQFVEFISNYV
ncbi:dienelactone hydrolase family-domain-containing protein [Trichophaea hybrida]|nr:dienelactone hydrolase family-domain-containing protein [Trichophaea hybrida]